MTFPAHGGRGVATEPNGSGCAPTPPLPLVHGDQSRRVRGAAEAAARRPRADACGRLAVFATLLAVLALLASGCNAASPAASGEPRELTVFAAASLTEAFTQLGDEFSTVHPDVAVTFNFAGSNDLVTQLQQGAPADVLATADTKSMDVAGDLAVTPKTFAGNKLVIAVAPGNPERITGLADLARKDIKLVLAAPEVPAGKYAAEIIDKAGVTARPVSLEVSVKGVVTKVSLGEADAGVVYVTDAAADGGVDGVAIPDDQNVTATYPIATVAASEHSADAQAFVDFVLSSEGRRILMDHGFLSAP